MNEETKKAELDLEFSNFNLVDIPKDKFDGVARVLLRKMEQFEAASKPEKLKDEAGVGVFVPENVKYFFSELRNSLYREASEAVEQAEPEMTIGQREKEQEWLKKVEEQFNSWLTFDNPLQKLEDDLVERGCTKATIREYLNCGRQYMKYTKYDPKFTPHEVAGYINHLKEKKWQQQSINNHLIVLKLWFDCLGLRWPYKTRIRRDTKVTARSRTAPTLTPKQVEKLIHLVREKGTEEDKYLMTIATTWAPRRQELGEIIGSNFDWDGNTGILKFTPMKHNFERIHQVPSQLVPYLKPYKGDKLREWVVGTKFTKMCRKIGFQLPTKQDQMSKEERAKVKNRRLFTNVHAFRHSIQTELIKRGIPKETISIWFGYAQGRDMPSHYFTLDEEEVMRVDELILKKHPYVKYWAD